VSDQDIQALAKGGRTNFLGFLLRLAGRLPFLFIAGRWYGAEALGRFASARVRRLALYPGAKARAGAAPLRR
jgi:hypothetical protein